MFKVHLEHSHVDVIIAVEGMQDLDQMLGAYDS